MIRGYVQSIYDALIYFSKWTYRLISLLNMNNISMLMTTNL